jgi:hypothetical protein
MELHRAGINVRYLGLVRYHATSPSIVKLLELEMAARVIKNGIRKRLRETMLRVQTISEVPFKECLIDILSKAVGARRDITFWKTVQRKAAKYFRIPVHLPIATEEIDQKMLIMRLQELADFRLSDTVLQEIAGTDDVSSFEFVDSDICDLVPKVRQMNIIDFAEGRALCIAAQRKKAGRERMRLLRLSEARLESAIASAPNNFLSLYHCGNTLSLQANEVDAAGISVILKAAA